jgi:hypothetical protein
VAGVPILSMTEHDASVCNQVLARVGSTLRVYFVLLTGHRDVMLAVATREGHTVTVHREVAVTLGLNGHLPLVWTHHTRDHVMLLRTSSVQTLSATTVCSIRYTMHLYNTLWRSGTYSALTVGARPRGRVSQRGSW